MKKLIRYMLAFCATVVLGILLLFLTSFLPQKPIDTNVKESADILMAEGVYPRILDQTYGSRLDNYTDSIIIMQSKAMSSQHPDRILTNPMFSYHKETMIDNLYGYAYDEDPEPSWYYGRYWMGFRAVCRLALVFFNYSQIRRYLGFVILSLMAVLTCSIVKNVGQRSGLLFALSVILIRPHVICNSMQFSCCFLIAFLAMLIVPWIYRNPKYESLFFMEIGMITMFFDFYTTPIVTFGLPMIYLCLLRTSRGESITVRMVMKNALIWLGAYVLMWIVKMLLTTLFTSQNALNNGMEALFSWMGIIKREEGRYNPILALGAVVVPIVSDAEGLAVVFIAVLAVMLSVIHFVRRGRFDKSVCTTHRGLLAVAALPLIWFAVAAEPTTVHFWFQYRSVVVLYWAIGEYLSRMLAKKENKTDITT